ncbi:MAG: class I SAM-dependent methyltransferase [Bacteroidota bacterium]
MKGNILHFSPARSIYRKLKKQKTIKYTSTDFADEFLADEKLDITNISSPSNYYDLILCYHVLEHVEKDYLAISELYRVLKSGGIVLIQTPFKEGEIYEDFTIKSPQERLKHFGQEDHVRVYSVEGLRERLRKVGLQVKTLHFKNPSSKTGLRREERVILAKKPFS